MVYHRGLFVSYLKMHETFGYQFLPLKFFKLKFDPFLSVQASPSGYHKDHLKPWTAPPIPKLPTEMEIDPQYPEPEADKTEIINDDDLFRAADNGDVSFFKSLSQPQLFRCLALRNEDGRSLLHVAVSSARTEVSIFLA